MSCSQDEKKETEPWQYLFADSTLENFHQLGGEAQYQLKDGILTGTTVVDSPNTFMATDSLYDDFILEYDFKVDSTINSGVQIRSQSRPEFKNGKVHGYQVEIDPSNRSWTAGIFDEARRGWLYPLENNPKAQKAFKQNDWNHVRVEAIADTIKTWLNDVPASYLIDDMDTEGFIAFQVHSIKGEEQAGRKIMWKDARIITDNPSKYTQPISIEPNNTLNTLTKRESDEGWELLWDGRSSSGWRGARLDEFPDNGWVMDEGILTVLETGGGESESGGDIVTVETFGDFELMLDFKITEGANSGIKYYVDTDLNKGPGSSIGLEFQILDDARHPDAKLGNHDGSRTMASLYDLIAADSSKVVKPIGQWNTAQIISKDNKVQHILNGSKVLEYQRGSDAYRQLVNESKYKDWPRFGEVERGHILLQDHGNRVSFRNIKIKSEDE